MTAVGNIQLKALIHGDYFKILTGGGTFMVLRDSKRKGRVRVLSLRIGKEIEVHGDVKVVWTMPPCGTDPELPFYFSQEEETCYIDNLIGMSRAGSKTADDTLRNFCGM